MLFSTNCFSEPSTFEQLVLLLQNGSNRPTKFLWGTKQWQKLTAAVLLNSSTRSYQYLNSTCRNQSFQNTALYRSNCFKFRLLPLLKTVPFSAKYSDRIFQYLQTSQTIIPAANLTAMLAQKFPT